MSGEPGVFKKKSRSSRQASASLVDAVITTTGARYWEYIRWTRYDLSAPDTPVTTRWQSL